VNIQKLEGNRFPMAREIDGAKDVEPLMA